MKGKRLIYLVVVIGLVLAGWAATSRQWYESASYEVLLRDGAFEIRAYDELFLASTPMQSASGRDGSFSRLFSYITGGNDTSQKIAMTTPVFMDTETPKDQRQMHFVLPRKITQGNVPRPLNDRVEIQQRDAGYYATLRFSGRLNSSTMQSRTDALTEWLEARGLVAIGAPQMAGYDPPWTPGFLRRNEVLIPVEASAKALAEEAR